MVSGPPPSCDATLSTPTCNPARNSSRSWRLMFNGTASPVSSAVRSPRQSGRVPDFSQVPLERKRVMVEPYQVVGLVPTMRGIRRRADISVNIEHVSHLIKAASWLSSLDLPVRLIAVPEGALQGFNDEVLDLDHEEFARECAIDIPGPETDALGALARQWNAYLMAQAKARHPEFPRRFFNVGFVLNPEGEIVLRHHKVVPLLPVEHSVTPHNVWDRWIELYGRNLFVFNHTATTE